jgi:uncharacterized protein with HEPN domain
VPSEQPRRRFQDILDNIGRIERHTAGMDAAAFLADARTIDAVERCLLRISEAAVKLGDAAERHCPGLPWREIRGLGNRLRHDYSMVETPRIWLIVVRDLPALRAACDKAIARFAE